MRRKNKNANRLPDSLKSAVKSGLKKLGYKNAGGKTYRHIKVILKNYEDLDVTRSNIEYEMRDEERRKRKLVCLQGMVTVFIDNEDYMLPIRVAVHPDYPNKAPFVFVNESEELQLKPRLKHRKYGYLLLGKLVNWNPAYCDMKILMPYVVECLSDRRVYAHLDFAKEVDVEETPSVVGTPVAESTTSVKKVDTACNTTEEKGVECVTPGVASPMERVTYRDSSTQVESRDRVKTAEKHTTETLDRNDATRDVLYSPDDLERRKYRPWLKENTRREIGCTADLDGDYSSSGNDVVDLGVERAKSLEIKKEVDHDSGVDDDVYERSIDKNRAVGFTRSPTSSVSSEDERTNDDRAETNNNNGAETNRNVKTEKVERDDDGRLGFEYRPRTQDVPHGDLNAVEYFDLRNGEIEEGQEVTHATVHSAGNSLSKTSDSALQRSPSQGHILRDVIPNIEKLVNHGNRVERVH